MSNRERNVLVTGGFGFIGFHLVAKLMNLKFKKIFVFDNGFGFSKKEFLSRLSDMGDSSNVKIIEKVNFKKLIRKEKIDLIYHLAAINGTRLFYSNPFEVLVSNSLINLELINSLVSLSNPPLLIYTSSSEVYSGLCPQTPTDEQVDVGFRGVSNPRWSYGLSKLLGEALLFSANRKNKNIKFVIARLHNIYGPRMGNRHVIPNLVSRVARTNNGKNLVIKNANDIRSFCYVDDAIEALVLLIKRNVRKNEIYNIGNPDPIKIGSLAKLIAKICCPNKNFSFRDGGNVDIGSVPVRIPDISKLKTNTGFIPLINLREGLTSTIRWWRIENEKKN